MFCFVASNSNINDGKVSCRAQDTEAKIRAFPCLLANIADVSAEGTSKWRGLLLESGVECVCVCCVCVCVCVCVCGRTRRGHDSVAGPGGEHCDGGTCDGSGGGGAG